MEHIIQFAIGIDDEAIVKRVQENAEKTIIKDIQRQVEQRIFETDWNGKPTGKLNYVAEGLITKWLDQHKDEIIQQAVKALADKLAKTKAVKTAVAELLEEDNHAEMQD